MKETLTTVDGIIWTVFFMLCGYSEGSEQASPIFQDSKFF